MLVRKPVGISLQQPVNVTHSIFIAYFPLRSKEISLCVTASNVLRCSSWAKHGGLGFFPLGGHISWSLPDS